MNKSILGFMIYLIALSASAEAESERKCEYAGQFFSVGATICECPSQKGEGGFAVGGGPASVKSRRMFCNDETQWADTGTLCLDLQYGISSSWSGDIVKFHTLYCPRQIINQAEIQKAISQETDRFFATAPKAQAIVAVQAICRRFGGLANACKAMIEALSAANN